MADTAICLLSSFQIRQGAPHKLLRSECNNALSLIARHGSGDPKRRHILEEPGP